MIVCYLGVQGPACRAVPSLSCWKPGSTWAAP